MRKEFGTYLEYFREESGTDLLHVKVIQSIQRGNRMPQRLAGSTCPPFRAGILIRITRTHCVQAADIAFHFGGSPWITALFSLPVTSGRRQLKLRWKILRQTGNATLQRVAVRFHPVFRRCRRGEVTSAISLLVASRRSGSGRNYQFHDVVVSGVRLGGRLLAGFVSRLNHRDRRIVHRRFTVLVVGFRDGASFPVRRHRMFRYIGRPRGFACRRWCSLRDTPLRLSGNRLSSGQMLLLTDEKFAVRAGVLLRQF